MRTRAHNTRLLSSRQRRHVSTRRISFSRDRGDADSHQVSSFIEAEEMRLTTRVSFGQDI
jgi:hypothetical protein